MTQPWTPQQGNGHQPYGPPPPQSRRPMPGPHPQGRPPYGPPPLRSYARPPQQPPSPRRPEYDRRQAYEPPVQRSYEPPEPAHLRSEPTPEPVDRHPEPRNGLGLAAAIVGPIGILFGLVPLTGLVAVICGLVAVPLAIAGRSRYKKRLATNGRTAMTGLLSGAVALALGVWGIVIVFQATNELVKTLQGPAAVSAGPAAGAGGAPGQVASADPGVVAFGQRVTFDDGVAIEVTSPESFEPGRYAMGNDRDRAVSFEITVVNGSDQPLDAVTTIVRATHAGRDAPLVFDAQKGMNGPPQGTVLPGKSITFPVAVSVGKDVADLQVDVTPRFVGDPAIFSGRV